MYIKINVKGFFGGACRVYNHIKYGVMHVYTHEQHLLTLRTEPDTLVVMWLSSRH